MLVDQIIQILGYYEVVKKMCLVNSTGANVETSLRYKKLKKIKGSCRKSGLYFYLICVQYIHFQL